MSMTDTESLALADPSLRRSTARKAQWAKISPKERTAIMREMVLARLNRTTPEERTAVALRGWATRKRKERERKGEAAS